MAAPLRARGPVVDPRTLIDTLEREQRLLTELLRAMVELRGGLASQDEDRVNDGVFAAHRVIRTLKEARRRRRMLLVALTGDGDMDLIGLDALLDDETSAAFHEVMDRIRETARSLSREIGISRLILHHLTGEAR